MKQLPYTPVRYDYDTGMYWVLSYNSYYETYDRVLVTKEVADAIKKSERKEKYLLNDLKAPKEIKDDFGNVIKIVMGREESIEQGLEMGKVYYDSTYPFEYKIEDLAVVNMILDLVPEKSRDLLYHIFVLGMTERQYSTYKNIPQQTVNARKHLAFRILRKKLVELEDFADYWFMKNR